MAAPSPELVQQRFRVTLELFDVAVAMQRQNLRRRYPEAPPEEIEARFAAWLQKRRYEGESEAG